jgi:hypothetical protein
MTLDLVLVAVLLYQNKPNLNPKVFLTAALLNAGALLGLLALQQRRKKRPDPAIVGSQRRVKIAD